MIVGIDASRARSGGATAHLVGIFSSEFEPAQHNVAQVHVWSYQTLLETIPNRPWLVKHGHKQIEKSLPSQILWQYFALPGEARRSACDVILYVDASSFVHFHPCVVMSRDMLSYEEGEMHRYGFSKQYLRLLAIKYLQKWGLQNADGALFLTKYASDVIQLFTGKLKHPRIIPHGIGEAFRMAKKDPISRSNPIKCVYVSEALLYKHQWHVIEAIAKLRKKKFPVTLSLVGAASGEARMLVEDAIRKYDSQNEFVEVHKYLPYNEIPNFLSNSHIYIFASSCENMPNTLIEGMAAGLPIVCSERGPMPEVLQDGGVYFDPENADSIAAAIERLLVDESLQARVALRAKELSNHYSWTRCANETFDFLYDVYKGAASA